MYTQCVHTSAYVPQLDGTHTFLLSQSQPLYGEAQSHTLYAGLDELLLLQCCLSTGVATSLPSTHLPGLVLDPRPPVSDFLPVFLTAFTLTSVSCVPLICLGLGLGLGGGAGEGICPH